MNLYVVRHAIAVPRRSDLEDALRPLTEKGRLRFQAAVRGLARLGVRLDVVLHSPWLRALQTAELLEPLLEGELVETELLAMEPSAELLAELPDGDVAVVGHEPWTSDLVAWLVSGDPRAGATFSMKKGGVVWLEGTPEPGGMLLSGFWRPRTLRELAG
jgi:phosphohistidine phosphatase